MTGSSMGYNNFLLNPSDAASLGKEQNPVSSLVLTYQKVINTMAFASGTRVNNLTLTLSGILTRKLSVVNCPWVT